MRQHLPLFLLTLTLLARAAGGADVVLDELADPDFVVREQVTQRMLADQSLSLERIAELYRQAWLPEQRQRLLHVGRHHAIAATRLELLPNHGDGAIGINQHGFSAEELPELGQPAVAVLATFAGFPGHAHLQPGDLILSVNGRPIPRDLPSNQVSEEFGSMVRDVKAGQVLHMTVRRHGQNVDVQFALASFDALRLMYAGQQTLQERFEARWLALRNQLVAQNATNDSPPPIRIDLPEDAAR